MAEGSGFELPIRFLTKLGVNELQGLVPAFLATWQNERKLPKGTPHFRVFLFEGASRVAVGEKRPKNPNAVQTKEWEKQRGVVLGRRED
jgi:hypothetical protein